MRTQLPFDPNISVTRLQSAFNNTSTSYKFYWFISLLEILGEKQEQKILVPEILTRMIVNAWYPIHYFKLSFGVQDKLSDNVRMIQDRIGIPVNLNKRDLHQELNAIQDKSIEKSIRNLGTNVLYRFLSPWIPFVSNLDTIERSKKYENNCPYAIEGKAITLHPTWHKYLLEYRKILLDFCYWNLTLYLQARNPNTPNIPNKLIKPISRSSLVAQRQYWEIVFEKNPNLSSIYTGIPLAKDNYDLDHFIPWSFVTHDLLWNLIPSDRKLNISKGNKLPSLDLYLSKFSELQQFGIRIVSKEQPNNKRLEDFTQLGYSIPDLTGMPPQTFKALYYKTMSPMIQIAENMGFERWNIHTSL